jgi:hypothetical protein
MRGRNSNLMNSVQILRHLKPYSLNQDSTIWTPSVNLVSAAKDSYTGRVMWILLGPFLIFGNAYVFLHNIHLLYTSFFIERAALNSLILLNSANVRVS